MKILLFGKNGQVGWEIHRSLIPLGDVIALGREDADFTDPESLRSLVRTYNPDVIVNAVAYTAVDKAEEDEEAATIINSRAPGVLAEEALKLNALLVHYSTDYVFDGASSDPYLETDQTSPVSVYGRTKLAGEQVVQSSGCDYVLLRTSWVYASRGHNFLLTILKLAMEREELKIVFDQVGSPTSARLIADTTLVILQQSIKERLQGQFSSGLYHLTASGSTSWHGFAREIIEVAQDKYSPQLKIKALYGIPSSDYPTPAKRPMNSLLSQEKLQTRFNVKMPSWKVALSLCMQDLIEKK